MNFYGHLVTGMVAQVTTSICIVQKANTERAVAHVLVAYIRFQIQHSPEKKHPQGYCAHI